MAALCCMSDAIGDQVLDVLIGEKVNYMLAIAATVHHPVRTQNSQPLRDRRDGLPLKVGEFGDTGRGLCQTSKQTKSSNLSKGTKDARCIFEGFIRDRKIGAAFG